MLFKKNESLKMAASATQTQRDITWKMNDKT